MAQSQPVATSSSTRSSNTSPGTQRLAWVLRTLILASGIYQTIWGEPEIGIITLICLAGIVFPAFVTRGLVNFFPIEVEIILFVMVLIQYVLGEARDLYINIPYYDKFVHAMLPGMLGLIGFMLAYSLVATGRLIAPTFAIAFLIVLMSLGAGAVEEIAEYASDQILYPRIPGWHHFQGNAQQDPHTDTMTDLIADVVGATFGAALGVWLIGRARRQGSERLPELVTELQTIWGRHGKAPPTDATADPSTT